MSLELLGTLEDSALVGRANYLLDRGTTSMSHDGAAMGSND